MRAILVRLLSLLYTFSVSFVLDLNHCVLSSHCVFFSEFLLTHAVMIGGFLSFYYGKSVVCSIYYGLDELIGKNSETKQAQTGK